MSEVQRQRILAVTPDVVAEYGVAAATVAHIVAAAGVSRRTFYELFEDRSECLAAAFEQGVARVLSVVVPMYEEQEGWREGCRAGLAALLGLLDREPGLRSLLIVDALGAGPEVLMLRANYLDALVEIVDRGRSEPPDHRRRGGGEPPPLAAEGVVGAILSVLHRRVLARDGETLESLLGALMGMIVLPYLGPVEARKELAAAKRVRGASPTKGSSVQGPEDRAPLPGTGGNPLDGLNMRLTHRTLRVLAALAGRPGASNREVADLSGISDQGQISKLLGRLEGLGLILNSGAGHAKGGPNAWALTARGEQLEHAIRA